MEPNIKEDIPDENKGLLSSSVNTHSLISSDEKFMLKNDHSLYDTRKHDIIWLKKLSNLPFFERTFRPIYKGSLRNTVITFLRVTLGVGIFSIPHYFKNVGMLCGSLLLGVSVLLMWFIYNIIFEAAHKSDSFSYLSVIKFYLGAKWYKFAEIFFLFDYVSSILIFLVATWNLFEYLAFYIGIFKE